MTLTHLSRPASTLGLAVTLVALAISCAGEPEFNRETRYTPQTVAQELVFRFKALPVAGKTSTKVRKARKSAPAPNAEEKGAVKSQAKAAPKKQLARTVDDLLDDVEAKVGLITGMPRTEALKKVIEAVSVDRTLDPDDRKMLTTRLDEMAGN